MNYLFAVGRVTDVAVREIEQAGGSVLYVSSVPSVQLVSITNPTFECMECQWQMRIKKGHMSLVWSGNHAGPEMTTIDETVLFSEWNEPRTPQTLSDDNLGDIDDCLF